MITQITAITVHSPVSELIKREPTAPADTDYRHRLLHSAARNCTAGRTHLRHCSLAAVNTSLTDFNRRRVSQVDTYTQRLHIVSVNHSPNPNPKPNRNRNPKSAECTRLLFLFHRVR